MLELIDNLDSYNWFGIQFLLLICCPNKQIGSMKLKIDIEKEILINSKGVCMINCCHSVTYKIFFNFFFINYLSLCNCVNQSGKKAKETSKQKIYLKIERIQEKKIGSFVHHHLLFSPCLFSCLKKLANVLTYVFNILHVKKVSNGLKLLIQQFF